MTPPTLSPPPAPPAAGTTPPARVRVRPPLRRTRQVPADRRVSVLAGAGSAALHLLLGVLAAVFWRVGSDTPADRVPAAPSGPVEVVDYYDVTPLPLPEAEAGPAAPAEPAPGSAHSQRAAAPAPAGPRRRDRQGEGLVFPSSVPSGLPPAGGAPAGTPGAAGAPAGSGAAGGALRPGYRDPRLYAPTAEVPDPPQPTEHERYMGRLNARLGEYNDSVAAAEERARKATDWTLKDKDGNRWGLSPGKIHMGKVTVPNPVNPAVGAPRWDDRERKEGEQRRAIDRQVHDVAARDNFKDRVKATRERKDAERKKRRGES